MKPFNLEAAKRGDLVITRDGRTARIICFDRVGHDKLVALVGHDEEEVIGYSINGQSLLCRYDLFMVGNNTVTKYIVTYLDGCGIAHAATYDNKESAEIGLSLCKDHGFNPQVLTVTYET